MYTDWQNQSHFRSRGTSIPADLARATPDRGITKPAGSEWSLVVDLGTRIGSADWFRGLATCVALCFAAISLAPNPDQAPGDWAAGSTAEARTEEAGGFGPARQKRGAVLDTPRSAASRLSIVVPASGGLRGELLQKGLPSEEAAALTRLIEGLVPPSDRPSGSALDIELGPPPSKGAIRPLEKLFYRPRPGTTIELKKSGGSWALTTTSIARHSVPISISGGATNQRDLPVGTSDASATVTSPDGTVSRLVHWRSGDKIGWFDEQGRAHMPTQLSRPVPGPVTSAFGWRRHPLLGYWRMHNGTDIKAAYGTPVLASADGAVSHAGWAGGRGKEVRLNHVDGLSTSYSHLSALAVKPGDVIRQHDVIGYAGSTGLSTGPHVHFEVRKHGRPQDPASAALEYKQLSGKELNAFRKKLDELKRPPN